MTHFYLQRTVEQPLNEQGAQGAHEHCTLMFCRVMKVILKLVMKLNLSLKNLAATIVDRNVEIS